jgi:hypothetical protein
MAEGGGAMNLTVEGPDSSSGALVFYDPAAKVIRITYASSKGIVNRHAIHREGDVWIRHTKQTRPDGTTATTLSAGLAAVDLSLYRL